MWYFWMHSCALPEGWNLWQHTAVQYNFWQEKAAKLTGVIYIYIEISLIVYIGFQRRISWLSIWITLKWAHKLGREGNSACQWNAATAIVKTIERLRRGAKRPPAGWHSPECGLHLHSAHLHSLRWLITPHHPLSAARQSPFIHIDRCTHTLECECLSWQIFKGTKFTILLILEGVGDCVYLKLQVKI